MDISKLSDLAKAIQNQERISAPSNVSKSVPVSATINGAVIPNGAVPVTESAHLVCDSADNMPEGSRILSHSTKDQN